MHTEVQNITEQRRAIFNYIAGTTVLTAEDVEILVNRLKTMITELFQYVYQTTYNRLSDEEAISTTMTLIDYIWMRGTTPVGEEVWWNAWYDSKIGLLVRGAIARYKLNQNKPLNAKELAILSGTSVANIATLLKKNRIRGEKRVLEHRGGYEWYIPPEEARSYLERGEEEKSPLSIQPE